MNKMLRTVVLVSGLFFTAQSGFVLAAEVEGAVYVGKDRVYIDPAKFVKAVVGSFVHHMHTYCCVYHHMNPGQGSSPGHFATQLPDRKRLHARSQCSAAAT